MKALMGAVALAVALATTPSVAAQADEPSAGAGDSVVGGMQAAADPTVTPAPAAAPAAAPTPTPTPTPPAAPTPTPPPPTPTPAPSPPAPTPTTTPAPTARPALRARQRLVLAVDRDRDGRADRRDSYRVTVTVTNVGNVALGAVRVADALVKRRGSNVVCGVTTLAPGRSTSCRSGLIRVTRGEARKGKVVNKARVRAKATSGGIVASPVLSRTLTVQRIAAATHKHKHMRKHTGKHTGKHKRQRPARRSAKLEMTQYVVGVKDANHNGRLQGGDSVRFGFRVVNSGSVSVDGLSVVDRRLARFKVPISCGTSSLAPGETTICTSGALRITPFQDARDKLGRNFAYATATTSGETAVRSNSTKVTLVRSTKALQLLANSGSDVTAGEVWTAGGLIFLGTLLMAMGRRRRRRWAGTLS